MTPRLKHTNVVYVATAITALLAACGGKPETTKVAAAEVAPALGATYDVHDTVIASSFNASGIATPLQQATVSTKLMGTIVEVLAKEGDVVAAGSPLVRIDARDLAAKSTQVAASIAEAEAVQRDALAQATRIRGLYADSVATRAQLDAVETAVARANAGVRAAHAAAEEVDAMSSYAIIRAPFSGTVTKRFVDPGAFAAPGAPLMSIQDAAQLRLVASVAPDVARSVQRGAAMDALIEGRPVRATVEGVVPSPTGNLLTINAIVDNPNRGFVVGSAVTLLVPAGHHTALVVPSAAIVRQGDLTGVRVVTATGTELRWIRLGATVGSFVEVTSGLKSHDKVVVGDTVADDAVGS